MASDRRPEPPSLAGGPEAPREQVPDGPARAPDSPPDPKPTAAPTRRRLPPGQQSTAKWPVLDLGERPLVDPARWQLTVAGAVRNRIRWDWATFRAQPQARITSDIHCVTAWSRFDNAWEGVSTRHLLSLVEPRPEARFVVAHGHDGYTTNLPLARFAAENALIAHSWQGQPLAREHGGPVRLVVPDLYFWKSAKWLRHLVFLEKDSPGYWEARGYHAEGDPWREDRYG